MESVEKNMISITELENKLTQLQSDIQEVDTNIKNVTGMEYRAIMAKNRKRRMNQTNDKSRDENYKERNLNFSKHKRIGIEPIVMDTQPKVASRISIVKNNKNELEIENGENVENDKNDKININEEKQNIPHQQLAANEVKRCTRIFGHLMKTLTDFKKDAEKNNDEQKKRDEIMIKVTEEEKQADLKAREERLKLLRLRNNKQRELSNVRKAIRYRELEQILIKDFKLQSNFIKTKTSPQLFFSPAIMNDSMKKSLKESNIELKKTLDDKIAYFQLAISAIENETKTSIDSDSEINQKSDEKYNDLMVNEIEMTDNKE